MPKQIRTGSHIERASQQLDSIAVAVFLLELPCSTVCQSAISKKIWPVLLFLCEMMWKWEPHSANLPGECRAEIQQFAFIGSSNPIHFEVKSITPATARWPPSHSFQSPYLIMCCSFHDVCLEYSAHKASKPGMSMTDCMTSKIVTQRQCLAETTLRMLFTESDSGSLMKK